MVWTRLIPREFLHVFLQTPSTANLYLLMFLLFHLFHPFHLAVSLQTPLSKVVFVRARPPHASTHCPSQGAPRHSTERCIQQWRAALIYCCHVRIRWEPWPSRSNFASFLRPRNSVHHQWSSGQSTNRAHPHRQQQIPHLRLDRSRLLFLRR